QLYHITTSGPIYDCQSYRRGHSIRPGPRTLSVARRNVEERRSFRRALAHHERSFKNMLTHITPTWIGRKNPLKWVMLTVLLALLLVLRGGEPARSNPLTAHPAPGGSQAPAAVYVVDRNDDANI